MTHYVPVPELLDVDRLFPAPLSIGSKVSLVRVYKCNLSLAALKKLDVFNYPRRWHGCNANPIEILICEFGYSTANQEPVAALTKCGNVDELVLGPDLRCPY